MPADAAKGEGIRFLLTTEFVYWHLQGREDAVGLLTALASAGRPYISAVSLLELQVLAAGQSPEGIALIEALRVAPVTAQIAARAAELLREPDWVLDSGQALVVATCLVEGFVLVHTWAERVARAGLLEISL